MRKLIFAILAAFSSLSTEAKDRTSIIYAHQDDDLLWFQPVLQHAQVFVLVAFPLAKIHEKILQEYPPSFEYSKRIIPLWRRISNEDFTAFWLNPCTRKDVITKPVIKALLSNSLSSPRINRFFTHNPWGETGHIHHQLVSEVVIELAQKYKKDVYVPALYVTNNQYITTDDFGLESVEFEYNHILFSQARALYQNARIGDWDAWTWSDGEFDYPTGTRKYLKVVDKGVDLSARLFEYKEAIHLKPIGECK